MLAAARNYYKPRVAGWEEVALATQAQLEEEYEGSGLCKSSACPFVSHEEMQEFQGRVGPILKVDRLDVVNYKVGQAFLVMADIVQRRVPVVDEV